MIWFVYLLRCSDSSLYCGISPDPDRRLDEHNQGKGSKYVRSRRPATLAWKSWPYYNKLLALIEEARIKRLPKKHKERLCSHL